MNDGLSSYCSGDGSLLTCPAGVYGASAGLTTAACSGLCQAGYYCPAGSASATAFECGGSTRYVLDVIGLRKSIVGRSTCSHACDACDTTCTRFDLVHCCFVVLARYCPAGTGVPLIVFPGNYSTPEPAETVSTRTVSRLWLPGDYCMAGMPYPGAAGESNLCGGRVSEFATPRSAG